MAHSKKDIEELLRLPPAERSALAEALLVSLEKDEGDTDADEAWAAEIERRVADDATGVPAEQVFAEGRARLKRDA